MFCLLHCSADQFCTTFHWHWSSGHLGRLAPTTHPQCRLVSNPCPAGRAPVMHLLSGTRGRVVLNPQGRNGALVGAKASQHLDTGGGGANKACHNKMNAHRNMTSHGGKSSLSTQEVRHVHTKNCQLLRGHQDSNKLGHKTGADRGNWPLIGRGVASPFPSITSFAVHSPMHLCLHNPLDPPQPSALQPRAAGRLL